MSELNDIDFNKKNVIVPIPAADGDGVSVEYVPVPTRKWYVLRASYGREDKARTQFLKKGLYAYIAQQEIPSVEDETKKEIHNLIPNILFVYMSDNEAANIIKSGPAFSYVTYYYNHFKEVQGKNPPLIVPNDEMENFIRITISRNEHIKLVQKEKCRFMSNDRVRITSGPFAGVEGYVARVYRTTCVVTSLTGFGFVGTAYIPSRCIEKV